MTVHNYKKHGTVPYVEPGSWENDGWMDEWMEFNPLAGSHFQMNLTNVRVCIQPVLFMTSPNGTCFSDPPTLTLNFATSGDAE